MPVAFSTMKCTDFNYAQLHCKTSSRNCVIEVFVMTWENEKKNNRRRSTLESTKQKCGQGLLQHHWWYKFKTGSMMFSPFYQQTTFPSGGNFAWKIKCTCKHVSKTTSGCAVCELNSIFSVVMLFTLLFHLFTFFHCKAETSGWQPAYNKLN